MKKYAEIIKHYENCLDKHGDTHLGVDWPKEEDVNKRYQVMLDLIYLNKENKIVSLLDFGCGTAHLMEFMLKTGIEGIHYSGLEISDKFVSVCKKKFPDKQFYCGDILDEKFSIGTTFDYVVMNGVFTEKRGLNFSEMWDYFTKTVSKTYAISEKGLAFNVMSKQVDWEREDLFHVPFDFLADFLCKNLTRKFVFRNDYGLYEYTVYIYK